MATMAIALPCLPGGADELRSIARDISGPRRTEFEQFHRRAGLSGERWFLQQTPQGELCIVVLEGDPMHALQHLATSGEPFERWFREGIKRVHGVDFTEPLPGPAPEMVLEA